MVAIAAPSLGFQVDVVQDHRNRRDAGAAEGIQRELHELAFGAAPTNDQRYAVRCHRETDCLGKAEDRRQIDDHNGKSILQVIDEVEKSPEVLARPSDVGGGARHKVNARALFDGDNVVGCAPVFKKIAQRETKILIEQPRDAGATQIRIDEDNVFAG